MTPMPQIILGLTLLLLPFLYSTATLDPVLLPQTILLAGTLLICNVFIITHPGPFAAALPAGFHRRILVVALMGYVLVNALAAAAAANKAEAIWELLKTALWAGAILTFIVVFAQHRSMITPFSRLVTLAAGVQAIIALGQYGGVAFAGIPGTGGMTGTMANRNLLASALALMFPFALYVAYRGGAVWRVLASAAVVLSLAVIVVSNTRAAWLAMLAGTLGEAVVVFGSMGKTLELRKFVKLHRTRIIIFGAAVAIIVGLFSSPLFRHTGQQSVRDRLFSIVTRSDRSSRERLALWDKSLRMFADHPLLGVGPGNWRLNIARYGTADLSIDPGVTFYQRPHNDYLWVLTEAGLFALICYLVLFADALTCALRVARHGEDPGEIILAASIVFGLTAFLVVGCFCFPKERAYHLLLSSLMLGVAFVMPTRTRLQSGTSSRKAVSLMACTITVCCAGCLVVGGVRLHADVHTRKALAARQAANWPLVIEEIDRGISRLAPLDPTSTPLAWYRGSANFALDRIDEALADFTVAYQVNPTHIHVLNNLAACYARKKEYDPAIRYYNEALALYPLFEETLINLAATYYNAGQYNKALETISRVDNTTTDARYRLHMEKIKQKIDVHPGRRAGEHP